MTPAPTPSPLGGPAWRDRLAVLGGLAFAATLTPVLLALGADVAVIQGLWMFAILWTVGAAIAGALTRGLRHGDWGAGRGGPAPDRTEEDEWATQTGRYTYLRDDDEEVVHRGSDVPVE